MKAVLTVAALSFVLFVVEPVSAEELLSSKQYVAPGMGVIFPGVHASGPLFEHGDVFDVGGASWTAAELRGVTHLRVSIVEAPHVATLGVDTRRVAAVAIVYETPSHGHRIPFCGEAELEIPPQTIGLSVFLGHLESPFSPGCVNPGTIGHIRLYG